MEVILANKEVILVLLISISEVLALIPSVKSNSIFELVVAGLKKLKEVFSPKV